MTHPAYAFRKRALFVVSGLLIGSSIGCGSLRGGDAVQAATADAQATATRRVAEATVQRMIAGVPTATPLPLPAPTTAPACRDAIWWYQARSHIGELRTVQGPVVATRSAANAAALIEIGQPYPDPTGVTVQVAHAPAGLDGKMVCVTGPIANDEGTPTIKLADAS
ncbi:MAG: hypothetical protein JOZ81_04400, partial [Chloroflexi bacterium]|nr:hypothetical protein [Chloroflexota bacterium]